jgi:hypothetical protein
MSAATVDRRLRKAKAACPGRGRRRRSSLEEHRREIPLKVDVWPEAYPKEPGYVEVDTVAHCGGPMAGSFAWTVTMSKRLNFDRLDGGSVKRYVKPAPVRPATWQG